MIYGFHRVFPELPLLGQEIYSQFLFPVIEYGPGNQDFLRKLFLRLGGNLPGFQPFRHQVLDQGIHLVRVIQAERVEQFIADPVTAVGAVFIQHFSDGLLQPAVFGRQVPGQEYGDINLVVQVFEQFARGPRNSEALVLRQVNPGEAEGKDHVQQQGNQQHESQLPERPFAVWGLPFYHFLLSSTVLVAVRNTAM